MVLLHVLYRATEPSLRVQFLGGSRDASSSHVTPDSLGNACLQMGTIRHIARTEGSRALWAGIRPRVLFHVPAAAITWSSYETMKVLLRDGTLTPV